MLKIDRNTRSNVTRVTGSVVKKAMLARKNFFNSQRLLFWPKLIASLTILVICFSTHDLEAIFLWSLLITEKVLIFSYHRPVWFTFDDFKILFWQRKRRKKKISDGALCESLERICYWERISFSGKFAVFTDQYTMLYSPVRRRLFKNRTLVPEWRLFPEIYLKIALFI